MSAGYFGRSFVRAAAAGAAIAAAFPASAECQLGKYLELPVTMRGARPIVSAQIGGKDVRFLLDSGAFFSTLSRAAAMQFGLKLNPMPPNFRMQGIGGDIDASLTSVKSFGIGPMTLPDVEFIVGGTDTGETGLLGQNFLHIGDVEYDVPHGSVRLLKSTDCGRLDLAYWAGSRPVTMVPLEPTGLLTIGTIILNGSRLRAVFDSGASTSLLTLPAARKAGFTPTSPGAVPAGRASGLGRNTMPAWIATFASIDIGGEVIRSPRLRFADVKLGDADLLIGADFFLTHRIYVSNRQHRMFVTYEGGPIFGLNPNGAVAAEGDRIDLTDRSDAPTDAEGFARRGAVAASNGKPQDAIADFDKAIALAPKEGRYLRQRAMARMANRQPLLAAADLDKAIALDPADIEAHGLRAGMRLGARDPDGAFEDLHILDAALPPTAGQRLQVARMADAAGHPELAVTNFDAWLKSHPDDAARSVALNGRCWARAQLNRELDAALADCNAAVRLRPGAASLLDSRALVYFRQGNLAAALADYDSALKIEPRSGWSLYARGLVKARMGDAAGAKADRDAGLAIDPRSPGRARKMGLES